LPHVWKLQPPAACWEVAAGKPQEAAAENNKEAAPGTRTPDPVAHDASNELDLPPAASHSRPSLADPRGGGWGGCSPPLGLKNLLTSFSFFSKDSIYLVFFMLIL